MLRGCHTASVAPLFFGDKAKNRLMSEQIGNVRLTAVNLIA
jgi:hypothetical protein